MQDLLKLADKQIEGNKPLSEIKTVLSQYFTQQHEANFYKQQREEYETLYPEYREPTLDEYNNYMLSKDEEFILLTQEEFDLLENKGKVKIYYEDDKFLTYEQYKDETKTVLAGTELATDDNGVQYEKEIFEDVPVRPYVPKENYDLEVEEYLNNSIEYNINQKLELLKGLDITVIKNGLRFYTDDKSMIDLIAADRKAERLGATDLDFTEWKTADGIKQVQIKDIREAIDLRLATKGGIVGVSS